MPTFTPGQIPTADVLQDLVPLYARKTADESVTSSTTLQNDDELAVTVSAGGIYTLDAFILFTGNETGDFQCRFTFPSGSTLHFAAYAPAPGDAGFNTGGSAGNVEFFARQNTTSSPSGVIIYSGSTAQVHLRLVGTLVVGSSAGTLQFQWAQNTSNGTATTVKAGSWLKLDNVSGI